MKCSVCQGTGLHYPPRVPSDTGGWLSEKYLIASKCRACNGSGYVGDSGSSAVDDSGLESVIESGKGEDDLEQLIDLQTDILSILQDSALPPELKDRWSTRVKAITFRCLDNSTVLELDGLCNEAQIASEQAFRFVSHLEPGKLGLVEMDLTLIAGALGRLKYLYGRYRADE